MFNKFVLLGSGVSGPSCFNLTFVLLQPGLHCRHVDWHGRCVQHKHSPLTAQLTLYTKHVHYTQRTQRTQHTQHTQHTRAHGHMRMRRHAPIRTRTRAHLNMCAHTWARTAAKHSTAGPPRPISHERDAQAPMSRGVFFFFSDGRLVIRCCHGHCESDRGAFVKQHVEETSHVVSW